MSVSAKYPPGLVSLFLVEMWERFSYYGMRAILVLFLIDKVETGGLGMATAEAAAIYGIYTASVYILALPGGWVADRLWGARKAILVGGVVIMIGHILLAVAGASAAIFYFGLCCIAIGTGLLKPNISTMVGQLYAKNDIGGRDAGFSFFYMGINIGAILGGLVAGYLGEVWGWHWGFGAAAVAMGLGLVNFVFASGRSLKGKGERPPVHHHPDAATGRRDHMFTFGIAAAIVLLIAALALTGRIDLATAQGLARAMGIIIVSIAIGFFLNIYLAGDLTVPEKRRMIVLAVLFVGAALFWSGFEQAGSSLNIFASDLTRRELGSFTIPASWFQNLNSLFIILLTPAFAAFWLYAEKRWTIPVFVKFGAGLMFLGLGYLLLVPAARDGLDRHQGLGVLPRRHLPHAHRGRAAAEPGRALDLLAAGAGAVRQPDDGLLVRRLLARQPDGGAPGLGDGHRDRRRAAGGLLADLHDQLRLRRGADPPGLAADPLGARRQRTA